MGFHEDDAGFEAPRRERGGDFEADVSSADDDGAFGGAHGVVQRERVGVIADVVDAGEGAADGGGELEGGASRGDDERVVGDGDAVGGGDGLLWKIRGAHASVEQHLDAVGVVPLLRLALAAAADAGVEAGEAGGTLLVEETLGQGGALVRKNVLGGDDRQLRAATGGDARAGEVSGGVAAADHDDLLGERGHVRLVGKGVCVGVVGPGAGESVDPTRGGRRHQPQLGHRRLHSSNDQSTCRPTDRSDDRR